MPGPEPEPADPGPERGATADALATNPDGSFCLREKCDYGIVRLQLSGELDISTAPELDQVLRTAQRQARSVIVDLRCLSFMDCRGLGAIVAAAKRADVAGSSFRVVRGPPNVHRLFTLTEADRQIEIADIG